MPLASTPGPDGLNAYPPHAACGACSLPVDWTRKLFYAPDAKPQQSTAMPGQVKPLLLGKV
jgi:hypothetical protein